MPMFLGLDIGTSGVKAILVSAKGQTKAVATAAHPMHTPRPGWAEQEPEAWWRAAQAAIRGVCEKSGTDPASIVSIGLSGQMHSSVFLDAKGTVIRPALLWCDGRTTPQCQAITRKVGEAQLARWVGNPALEGFTLPKVLWLKENEPAAFRRLDKVILPKDYIRYKLTGQIATELSDASATLMYDVTRRRWSRDMMKAVGLSMGLLPDVGGSAEVLGTVSAGVAKRTGLSAGIPVAGGGADNACAAVGVGLTRPGDAVVSWGTSGTVVAPTKKPVTDAKLRVHSFCHVVPDTWYSMGCMLTAGAAFGWYRDQLGGGGGAKGSLRLNKEAAAGAPGARGLTFLPYFQGERSPHRDVSARGALVGLTLAHRRADVSRAVLEGVCFGLRDSLEILRSMGLNIGQVLLTGGGAQSPVVRQMQADIYGVAVRRVNQAEGPAYGAALLGAVACKAFKDIQTACKATITRLKADAPRPGAHRAYAAPYQKFKDLYPALKGHF